MAALIRRAWAPMVAALCLVMMTAAGTAVAAPAATDPVSWSVTPAGVDGPDGRRTVDQELQPGASVTEHVAVKNFSRQAVTFAISANDGYLTERGSFDMRPLSETPVDGGSWFTVPAQVEVAAGGTVIVPVQITVPADATPGDHPAGVAASVMTTENSVRVENRVGVRFDLRVPGELVASIDATLLDTGYETSWNPLAPGTAVVTYELVNSGNVAATVTSTVSTSFLGLGAGDPQTVVRELLPGDRVGISQRVPGVWPLGPIELEVASVPEVEEQTGGTPVTSSSAPVSATVVAPPYPQLLALALAGLLWWGLRRWRQHRRAALDRLLDQARAEGASSVRHADGAQL